MRRLAAVQAALDAAVVVAETTVVALPDNLVARVQDATVVLQS
jgi:hypothetical protein